MIELTTEQQRAMAAHGNKPMQVRNPVTQAVYVLVPKEVYELTCRIISGPNRCGWDDPIDDDLIRS